ncbi:caspase family protein [Streptomyces halstedii]|uniref:HD domain-containing protein n=1 Tax=Streptomyces halstedii TaxID=1944 RepID=UPI003809CE61
MGTFRALLIPVAEHLPFAAEDTRRIREALISSQWEDGYIHTVPPEDGAGLQKIVSAIHGFFKKCDKDDFALVYFSGHGVRINGVDYLVPGDVEEDAEEHGLIPVNDSLLKNLDPGVRAMLCLDACRDRSASEFRPMETTEVQRPGVVLVQACAPGDVAGGTVDGSFMGQALAEALSSQTRPSTVREVIDYITRRSEELAEGHGFKPRVTPRWFGSSDSSAGDLRVCHAGPGLEQWAQALHNSRLWERTDIGAEETERLKPLLNPLVTRVLALLKDAGRREKAGPDVWDDPQFPERVLIQLHRLVPEAPTGRLSALELVVLLATPFVREAAVACGRRILAELYAPEGPPPDAPPEPASTVREQVGQDMADIRKAFSQIEERRRRTLQDGPGGLPVAEAIEHWLRHRLLADWDQLWEPLRHSQESPPLGLDGLARVIDQLTSVAQEAALPGSEPPPPNSRACLRDALLQVVMQMRTLPVATAADGRPWQVSLPWSLGSARLAWRPRQLAGLLHMAELLAIDSRGLDGIVVDHLGTKQLGILPEEVISQVQTSDFRRVSVYTSATESDDWTLIASCTNAALHLALERQADAAVTAAHRLRRSHHEAPHLFSRLPQNINTDALRPSEPSAYEAPPPRFQLAEDGVKPLIMGTQLYGDHMLAVRELYQNALDAYRRRWARQHYAESTGQIGAADVDDPADCTIHLTLAEDEDGRLYIECGDEGIGMTVEELRDLFARAGRRYEQSPTRVRELRRWRRKGINPELNSRFGIGVFSYFMLAEEIRVTTRPASDTGRSSSEPAHRVEVVSDSGLMHIGKDERRTPGTTVRLYLRREFCASPPSLIRFLRENVWRSPVNVVVEDREEVDRWTAGKLRAPVELAVADSGAAGNVWWVRGEGARLIDGIVVRGAERPHGYIVNLQRRHAPVLSASRNDLQSFDTDAVHDDLGAATDVLKRWDPMPVSWLWSFCRSEPRMALLVLRRLLEAGTRVVVRQGPLGLHPGIHGFGGTVLPLTTVGCLPFDENSRHVTAVQAQHFAHWRNRLNDGRRAEASRSGSPTGFPPPAPLDSLLFRDAGDVDGEWKVAAAALRAAADSGVTVRECFRSLRRYAVTGVPVPPVQDVHVLDGIPADHLAAQLLRAYRAETASRDESDAAHPPPEHAPVLLVAGNNKRSVGEVTDLTLRLREFAPHIAVPPGHGSLSHHIPAPDELAVLRELPAEVTPLAASWFAAKTSREPAAISDLVRRYEAYGYRLTEGVDYGAVDAGDAAMLGLASYERIPQHGLLRTRLTLDRLISLSLRRNDRTIGDTAKALRGVLRRLGMEEPDPGCLSTVPAPRWWDELSPDGGPWTGKVGVWAAVRAFASSAPGMAAQEVDTAVALARAGLVEESLPAAVEQWLRTPGTEHPQLLVLNYAQLTTLESSWSFGVSVDVTTHTINAEYFILAAAQRHMALGDTVDRLAAEAARYAIPLDPLPEQVRDLRPDLAEFSSLCTERRVKFKDALTHREVVEYADYRRTDLSTALRNLRAYEALGAPRLPDLPPFEPGPEDTDVEGRLRQFLLHKPLSEGVVTPLALVVSAVRLSLGVRATYKLLTRYTGIGLTLACAELPAEDRHIPDWQDALILTRFLNAREPALAGDVSGDHVRLAAEETGLDPGQVLTRLTYYAPLFGLRMTQGPV